MKIAELARLVAQAVASAEVGDAALTGVDLAR